MIAGDLDVLFTPLALRNLALFNKATHPAEAMAAVEPGFVEERRGD